MQLWTWSCVLMCVLVWMWVMCSSLSVWYVTACTSSMGLVQTKTIKVNVSWFFIKQLNIITFTLCTITVCSKTITDLKIYYESQAMNIVCRWNTCYKGIYFWDHLRNEDSWIKQNFICVIDGYFFFYIWLRKVTRTR